jgi:hypothetical protein
LPCKLKIKTSNQNPTKGYPTIEAQKGDGDESHTSCPNTHEGGGGVSHWEMRDYLSRERLRASLTKSRGWVFLTLKLKAETKFVLITTRLMLSPRCKIYYYDHKPTIKNNYTSSLRGAWAKHFHFLSRPF